MNTYFLTKKLKLYNGKKEEKVRSSLEHIGTGDHFLNITAVAQTLRVTNNT